MKHLEINIAYQSKSDNELSDEETKLIDAAKQTALKAYAPYSNFQVGAAVLLDNGEIICGNNQENAAYPSGLCAERVALYFAGASHPEASVVALAICAYTNGDFTEDIVTPCGSCRQVINESYERQEEEIKLMLYSKKGTYIFENANSLLPLSFDHKNLKIK